VSIIASATVIISAGPMRWLERADAVMCPRRSEVKHGTSRRLGGYVSLLRPINALMMAFAVLVGVFLAGGDPFTLGIDRIAAGMATGFLVLGSAMVLNDYADADIDRINAPHRPIPSGIVSRRAALIYGVSLGLAGLVTAAYTGPYTLILALLAWVVSVIYDFRGKKTGLPGNLMVSFNVAMPIAYGAALASRLDSSIAVFWLMIFLANTGREIIKGIADVAGDAARGVRTLAAVRGMKAAAVTAAVLVVIAVAMSPLPLLLGDAAAPYLLVIFADIGFIHASISIVRDPSPINARKVKQAMLLYMLVGLVAFLLARLG
jgi:geranylgeranylglycerol-phosphate geranylgeranyltransferase